MSVCLYVCMCGTIYIYIYIYILHLSTHWPYNIHISTITMLCIIRVHWNTCWIVPCTPWALGTLSTGLKKKIYVIWYNIIKWCQGIIAILHNTVACTSFSYIYMVCISVPALSVRPVINGFCCAIFIRPIDVAEFPAVFPLWILV